MDEETKRILIQNLPAIITAFGMVITAIGVILGAYWSFRANKQSKANAEKIEEVHIATNGQSEHLQALREQVGFGKGEKSARAEDAARKL